MFGWGNTNEPGEILKIEKDTVEAAIKSFSEGKPVLIHDFEERENEIDLVVSASAITHSMISQFRNDAGGLVCVAVSKDVADILELPFLSELINHPLTLGDDLKYDTRSAFSLPVNHRDTYTGITDIDRELTIKEISRAAESAEKGEYTAAQFVKSFRSPGHVQILRAAGSLEERKGHTELGIALSKAAGMGPAVVVCEMLDDESGKASSKKDAENYANENGLSFVGGKELIESLGNGI